MSACFSDGDFVSSGYLAEMRRLNPQMREDYLAHLQKIYNYKLHTDFPMVLHIEPTNECNQTCRMCCHPTMKREVQYISDGIVKKAIAEATIYKPWSTHFFFFGEPFLNKKLFKYIDWAKTAGLRNISTTSNFTALTESKVRLVPNSGLDSIHISFEGLNREHYKMVRGKDTFEKAHKNISLLIEEKHRVSSSLWISLTFVRTSESDEEIKRFTDYWRPLVNDIHISPQFEYRNGSEGGERRQEISKIQFVRNDGNIMFTKNEDRVPCRQLWTRLVVASNGEMTPCSQNIDANLSLGNIANTSIHEAWTGRAMQELRMQHLSNSYHTKAGKVCLNCSDWDWSGRVDVRPTLLSENK